MSDAVISALLPKSPLANTLAVNSKVSVAPNAMDKPVQLMVFPVIVEPAVIAVTVLYPLGTTSSTATPVTSLIPSLVISNLKVTLSPTFGEVFPTTDFTILKSE